MRKRSLSLVTFRKIVLIALFALAFIIVSGGAVRLTGSGLGCPDWPQCSNESLVAPLSYHPMIEFVNRVITGLVSVAVIAAMVGSLYLKPRRRDLVWLSFGMVMGVVAQIVWGGLTVIFDLNPAFVAGHFIISMLLVADAVLLLDRTNNAIAPTANRGGATRELFNTTKLMIASVAIAIALGTVVTGSGPHGGDETAKRFNLVVGDVARLHGIAVMIFLGLTLFALWQLKNGDGTRANMRVAQQLLIVSLLQALVGYTQYFTGVPALLVGIHLAGATAVWIWTLRFSLSVSNCVQPVSNESKVFA